MFTFKQIFLLNFHCLTYSAMGGEGGAEGGIRESYFLKKKIEKGKGKEVT